VLWRIHFRNLPLYSISIPLVAVVVKISTVSLQKWAQQGQYHGRDSQISSFCLGCSVHRHQKVHFSAGCSIHHPDDALIPNLKTIQSTSLTHFHLADFTAKAAFWATNAPNETPVPTPPSSKSKVSLQRKMLSSISASVSHMYTVQNERFKGQRSG
jgi:hypothetical protein